MNLKPLADRVVIKPKKAEEKTKGGIYLPETATKEKPLLGHVMAVGVGKLAESGKRVAPEVKEGDEVIFSKYAGTEVKIDDEEFLIMREDDILAINQKK
jgi:chaperonin GroES